MKKYPSFRIDFLGCKVNAIFDKNWKEIARKILKRPLRTDEVDVESNAIALHAGNEYYILADRSIHNGAIYHECFHVFMWIADDYNFKLSVDDQELPAYLLAYLIEETLKIKKGIKK